VRRTSQPPSGMATGGVSKTLARRDRRAHPCPISFRRLRLLQPQDAARQAAARKARREASV
jgi:hypothetical protein